MNPAPPGPPANGPALPASNASTSPARSRFAPSPTGRLHIGGARTALYDFLLARQTQGQFLLRIEDTDRKRLVPGAEEEQREALEWLGLAWDEGPDVGGPVGPYRQSERTQIYHEHAQLLVRGGNAYACFCTPDRLAQVRQEQQKKKLPPRYDGRCRDLPAAEVHARLASGEGHVIRFRTPREGTTTAVDLLRGPITVENASLDDYILLKSDGLPVYHLAALVDDRLMGITHVLRSSEWLPTFPLHVLIYQAFGWEQPVWVHLSIFLNPSGKGKMSKRGAGETVAGAMSIQVLDLRAAGYLPEAVINWIALMGWSLDDHTEVFTLPELVQAFSIGRLNASPAAVNYSKLDHFNGIHIRTLSFDELAHRLSPFFAAAGLGTSQDQLRRIAPLVQERIRTLEEAVEIAGFFFRDDFTPTPAALVPKGLTPSASQRALERALEAIRSLGDLEFEPLEARLRREAADLELEPGQLFSVLRIAVTGQAVSPPLLPSMQVLGVDIVVRRIERAIGILTLPV
ncbi:MAG: glutamate--tRNA ligase [Anaerolineales bacterium]